MLMSCAVPDCRGRHTSPLFWRITGLLLFAASQFAKLWLEASESRGGVGGWVILSSCKVLGTGHAGMHAGSRGDPPLCL
jgi:hypothetical protein